MPDATPEEVLSAIAGVRDPVFDRPLVELGLVKASVDGGAVALTVRESAPSAANRVKVEAALAAALPGREVRVTWDLEVPTRDLTGEDPVPGVRNVILVLSGKGGVGKSTVAANLALALLRAGARVGLLDADIYGPSVPTMLGVTGHPSSADGVHIEPLERFGLKLMSIGFLVEDPTQAIVWRGPMLNGALTQFLRDVAWGKLDYLVLDLPPGTGDVALTLAQKVKVTGAVIVTTPQEVALADVYKSVSMCEKLSIPILGVIENMSFFVDSAGVRHALFGEGGGQKVADLAKAPLLGRIPIEQSVREWGDKGTPIVQAAPESASAAAFVELAMTVAEKVALMHFQRTGGKAPATEAKARLKIVR